MQQKHGGARLPQHIYTDNVKRSKADDAGKSMATMTPFVSHCGRVFPKLRLSKSMQVPLSDGEQGTLRSVFDSIVATRSISHHPHAGAILQHPASLSSM